jgi:hypothetical protein
MLRVVRKYMIPKPINMGRMPNASVGSLPTSEMAFAVKRNMMGSQFFGLSYGKAVSSIRNDRFFKRVQEKVREDAGSGSISIAAGVKFFP